MSWNQLRTHCQMTSARLHMNAGCREGRQAPRRRRSIEDDLRLSVLAGHS